MNQDAQNIMAEMERIREVKTRVRESYPDSDFPNVVKEPLFYGRKEKLIVPDRFAVVNKKTDSVFGIASSEYKVIHHEEALDAVQQSISQLPEYGRPIFKPEFLKEGARMRLRVEFPEVKLEVRKGDMVRPEIRAYNSYDLGWKFTIEFGAHQLVCSNGMVAYRPKEKVSKRHMNTLSVVNATQIIGDYLEKFSEQTQLWSSWAEKNLSLEEFGIITEALPFSDAQNEKILALPIISSGNKTVSDLIEAQELTAWDVFSAYTQYTTHEIDSELRKIEFEEALAKKFTVLMHN